MNSSKNDKSYTIDKPVTEINSDVYKSPKRPFSFQLDPARIELATPDEKQELVIMRESTSLWKDAWRRFRRNHFAMIALAFIIFMFLFAFLGPVLSPYSYDQQIRGSENMMPSFEHPFGTDKFGRDIMVRIMDGTQVSLVIGVLAAFVTLIIGSIYGAISGLASPRVDNIMMRIVEIIYSMPDTLIVILLSIALKAPLDNLLNSYYIFEGIDMIGAPLLSMFFVFAFLYWVTMARIVRGQVLALKEQEFVLAAYAMGAGKGRIIRKHLLLNSMGPIIVTATLQIPSAIFVESFLSFIGLGISAPKASLGSMVNDALNGIYTYPMRLVFPAVTIALIILAFNTLGDALRDVLDPRMKK
jgi:oligopeptide transport system permease protein